MATVWSTLATSSETALQTTRSVDQSLEIMCFICESHVANDRRPVCLAPLHDSNRRRGRRRRRRATTTETTKTRLPLKHTLALVSSSSVISPMYVALVCPAKQITARYQCELEGENKMNVSLSEISSKHSMQFGLN